jgi:hypothetical protein
MTWNKKLLDLYIICHRYKQHQYKKHNGLAWIEEEDKPIDFRDTTIENQNHLSNLIREAFSRKGGNRTKGGLY